MSPPPSGAKAYHPSMDVIGVTRACHTVASAAPKWILVLLATTVACGQVSRDQSNADVSGNAGTHAGGTDTGLPDASGSSGIGGSLAGGTSGAAGAAGAPSGGGGVSSGGTGGTLCNFWQAPCAPTEFCTCDGKCAERPTECPTECKSVCGCGSGPYCNPCLANFYGDDANDKPYSQCSSDGGQNGWDGGHCAVQGDCFTGLKCCFVCDPTGGCSSRCTPSDSSGACPPL